MAADWRSDHSAAVDQRQLCETSQTVAASSQQQVTLGHTLQEAKGQEVAAGFSRLQFCSLFIEAKAKPKYLLSFRLIEVLNPDIVQGSQFGPTVCLSFYSDEMWRHHLQRETLIFMVFISSSTKS